MPTYYPSHSAKHYIIEERRPELSISANARRGSMSLGMTVTRCPSITAVVCGPTRPRRPSVPAFIYTRPKIFVPRESDHDYCLRTDFIYGNLYHGLCQAQRHKVAIGRKLVRLDHRMGSYEWKENDRLYRDLAAEVRSLETRMSARKREVIRR